MDLTNVHYIIIITTIHHRHHYHYHLHLHYRFSFVRTIRTPFSPRRDEA